MLRLVDEALAARHAGDPSSQPQPQPLQVAADASRHVVAPRTGANPIKSASAGAALTFLPTTVPAPANRASPGEERLPAVDLDLDQVWSADGNNCPAGGGRWLITACTQTLQPCDTIGVFWVSYGLAVHPDSPSCPACGCRVGRALSTAPQPLGRVVRTSAAPPRTSLHVVVRARRCGGYAAAWQRL